MADDLRSLFNPRAVAFVGVSPDPMKYAGRALAMLRQGGFSGPIFAVNPKYRDVLGVPCVNDTSDLPAGEIDLAFVAVSADRVPDVIAECGRKGIARYEHQRPVAAPVAGLVAQCSVSSEALEFEIDVAEREAIAIELGGVPPLYALQFAKLQVQPSPEVPRDRWHQFVNDAGIFLDQHGREADRLGWTAEDLFGLSPAAPMDRFDRMGLIWMLHGETVIEITATTAKLSGGLTCYREADLA